ncbi:MAG: tyrosine-type recombinase/integrase [Turicibacter sanguinis]|uniref:tyrosine-type recombinase/integrase n=1 Tax=Turicibacter sanguinis TaxID=154288 RepID=UPI003991F745
MTTALQLIHSEEELNSQSLSIEKLKSYPEKTVHPDGTVTTEYIETTYFLENDIWDVDFFFEINQFQSHEAEYNRKRKKFHFTIENESLKIEFKYLTHYFIFQDKWNLSYFMNSQQTHLKKLFTFLDEKYLSLNTLLDLNIEKAEKEWLFYLNDKGFKTMTTQQQSYGEYTNKTSLANILRNMYDNYFNLLDTRVEWEKDSWDVRILNQQYGLEFNKSKSNFYINFFKISNPILKNGLKKYCKQRLLSRNNFSIGTAMYYCTYISLFLNFIIELEPTWNDLKGLNRQQIEKFIIYLNEYTKIQLKQKNSNPKIYILKSLSIIEVFLSDIQQYDYEIAPTTPIQKLMYPEDRPKLPKKSIDQIDYIPDFVLEQLFKNINELHEEVVPVVYVAFRSGLRICDVLDLNSDCLVRLNGKYYIQTDIQKVSIEGHRIPIDEKLADLLAVEIKQSKELSNQDNNPKNLIFVRYRGSRKGYPYSQNWIRDKLNDLTHKCQIKDEDGRLFHFTMHQFRHTYGVKMLNGGADILVVQELLAHTSPEMTLTYAKLLDETKRKAFDEVMKKGVFSFNNGNQIVQFQPGEDIPDDILETLYRDHKLTAMDNPYGTCHARIKGSCPHMDEPPCLTCNGGKPCNDLAIGFSEEDTLKYELLVKTTTKSIKMLEQHGRKEITEKTKKKLEIYQSILDTLQQGEIIFGNLERLKRRRGESNG